MEKVIERYLEARRIRIAAETAFREDKMAVGADKKPLLDESGVLTRDGIIEYLRKGEHARWLELAGEAERYGYPSVEIKAEGYISKDSAVVQQWAQEQADEKKRAVWFTYDGRRYEAIPSGAGPAFGFL